MTLKEKQFKRNKWIIILVIVIITISLFLGWFIPRLTVGPFLSIATSDLYSIEEYNIRYYEDANVPVETYKLNKFAIDGSVMDFITVMFCLMSFVTAIAVATIMILYKSNTLEGDLSARDEMGKKAIIEAVRQDIEECRIDGKSKQDKGLVRK